MNAQTDKLAKTKEELVRSQNLSENAQIIREIATIDSLAFRNHKPAALTWSDSGEIAAPVLLKNSRLPRNAGWPMSTISIIEHDENVGFKYGLTPCIQEDTVAAERANGQNQVKENEHMRLLEAGWKAIATYRGIVEEIDVPGRPNHALLRLSDQKQNLVRLFPKTRLAPIKAVFPGAQVQYTIYALGTSRMSSLDYVGPTRDQLLGAEPKTLSKKTIEALGTRPVGNGR